MLIWHPKSPVLHEVDPNNVPTSIAIGTLKRCSERGNWYVRVRKPDGRRRWHPFGDPKHLPKQLRMSLLLLGIRP